MLMTSCTQHIMLYNMLHCRYTDVTDVMGVIGVTGVIGVIDVVGVRRYSRYRRNRRYWRTRMFNMLNIDADGTRDKNLKKRHRTLEELAYANSHD